MRVAILTDIHGNRPAFEGALAAVDAWGAEEVWCLGDLVGYGAEPDACVELARSHATVCLAGNHDLAVRGDIPLDDFSPAAARSADWTRDTIGPEALAWLRERQPQAQRSGFGLYHASPRDPVWEYVLSTLVAAACLDTQPERVCLIGHSHVALAFSRLPGEAVEGRPHPGGSRLALGQGTWLINPGSVGQPRDGDPRAAWLELDTARQVAVYRRTEYDVAAAQAAVIKAGLPGMLAERLALGQ